MDERLRPLARAGLVAFVVLGTVALILGVLAIIGLVLWGFGVGVETPSI